MPKIRNIIIFIVIVAALVLIYVFFIKPSPDQANLVSAPAVVTGADSSGTTLGTEDFLTLLLSVKSIKLDDSIFSDPAFQNLHDSSITLVPDATIGRPNPFAQFGAPVPSVPAPIAPSSSGVVPSVPTGTVSTVGNVGTGTTAPIIKINPTTIKP